MPSQTPAMGGQGLEIKVRRPVIEERMRDTVDMIPTRAKGNAPFIRPESVNPETSGG